MNFEFLIDFSCYNNSEYYRNYESYSQCSQAIVCVARPEENYSVDECRKAADNHYLYAVMEYFVPVLRVSLRYFFEGKDAKNGGDYEYR